MKSRIRLFVNDNQLSRGFPVGSDRRVNKEIDSG
jgi:hypothetical protein